ncbi:hypothetical protein TWF481_008362 [Arthrobotrys musiformis]|uniref:F-box domain-containing protein n=1 Tax=Arthrobotrys musiformis TaxID=47236 RepID=A0AAV9W8S6_9PEZI
MTQPSSFENLPSELHDEIIKYLDNDSAKSLRLAYPTPQILTTTSDTIFETLVLRLGNHRNSRNRLDNLRSCLLEENGQVELSTNGILRHVRTLVVDTRYPFVVTDQLISTRRVWRFPDEDVDLLGPGAHGVYPPDEEVALFLDLLKKVFYAISSPLKSLRWQTSHLLKSEVHEEIAELFCSSTVLGPRNYEFTVSFSSNVPHLLIPYLRPLSGCDHLYIVEKYGGGYEMELDDMVAVVELIRRCPKLKGFTCNYENWIHEDCLDALWTAINGIETLEELKFQTGEDVSGPVRPNLRSKRLKGVNLDWIDLGYLPEMSQVPDFCEPLVDSGATGLTKLAFNTYLPVVQKLILQQTAVTDLTIRVMDKWDAIRLFSIVVPAIKQTLRRFRLTGSLGNHSWGSPTNYGTTLLDCKKLQEIEVPFIQRDFTKSGEDTVISGLPSLVNDFVRNCPELFRIYTGNIAGDFCVAYSLIGVLKKFESRDGIFKGRDLEILLKQHAEGEWGTLRTKTRFPRVGDEEDMVGVFDYYIHRWRLREEEVSGDRVYRFQRLEDKCWMRNECWDDD